MRICKSKRKLLKTFSSLLLIQFTLILVLNGCGSTAALEVTQSEAVQRSIAVTVAQMYIDAEGRDETARRMIKSMATKVPVLSEEIKAIERRQKETQQRVGR